MCRNIKTLYNFDPPASDEEIRKREGLIASVRIGKGRMMCHVGGYRRSRTNRLKALLCEIGNLRS